MRKLFALTALLIALPAAGAAQEAPRGQHRMMGSTVEFLVASQAELNVSAEQAAQLAEISKQFTTGTASLRKDMLKLRDELNAGGSRQQIFAKLQPIRAELEKQDAAAVAAALLVLNAEQQAIAKQLVASRSSNRPARPRASDTR